MTDLYKNWAYIGPFIALYVVLVLVCNMDSMGSLVFWIWLQFPIYLIHEFEEHAMPGKFRVFVNKEIFHVSENVPSNEKRIFWSNTLAVWIFFPTCGAFSVGNAPLNEKRVFWINILAVWILFPICGVLSQFLNPCYGIYIVYFALFNASLHILLFIIKKKYNPGFLASVFLNYPGGLYTLWLAQEAGILDFTLNITAFLFAFFGHVLMVGFVIYWYKQYKNALKNN